MRTKDTKRYDGCDNVGDLMVRGYCLVMYAFLIKIVTDRRFDDIILDT